jgi:hypothetical protein
MALQLLQKHWHWMIWNALLTRNLQRPVTVIQQQQQPALVLIVDREKEFTTRVQKFQVPGRRGNRYLWVLSLELAACYPPREHEF